MSFKEFDGWREVIALTLYKVNRSLRNYEIERDPIILSYIKDKKKILKRLPGIISKTLNTYSEPGISNDKGRRAPYIFGKDDSGRWFLNDKGKQMVRKYLDLEE
jgi:hypothetical protein